jgi:hypothetical protein
LGEAGVEHFVDMMRYWDWNYGKLLAFIVALGAVATALLQLINDLTPVRTTYHLWLLRRWIDERVRFYQGKGDPRLPHTVDADEALSQLIAHATGGHSRAFLGLLPSQLVAQINAAAQGALENPAANVSLIAVLAQPTEPQVPLVLKSGQAATATHVQGHIDDLLLLLELADRSGPSMSPINPEDMKKYMEARTRVVHRIQRNLDGMQITLGNNSAVANQLLAILISTIICYAIVIQTRNSAHTYFYTVLLIGISGGYVAPLLGDLVAVVRRWGRT